MHRRTLMQAAGALGLAAAARRVRAQGATTLRFVPVADLAVLDPIITSAYVTRNHALMVFDTLYGLDAQFRAQPQMVAGHTIDDDGRTWTMTLREGLRFHDDTPVLSRDAIASIQRWASRDAFGAVFNQALDTITTIDDKTFRIKLRKPFPRLLDGFAHCSTQLMPIMPERLAKTPGTTQITEMVGSGPYRFVAAERVPGSRAVYTKFDGYVPRSDPPSFLAGAKIAHIPRIEWHTIPDAATAAAALRSGEVDWWEQPTIDLLPQLRAAPGITTAVTDEGGNMGILRVNHLVPPFDNPAIRRVILKAANQTDFMTAVVGEDKTLYRDGVGVFTPNTPLANDAGLAELTAPKDYAKLQQELKDAGYKGERIVMLAATDFPSINAMCEVAGDMYRKLGMNLDYQSVDWGTVVQRRNSQEQLDRGGWSTHCTYATGYDSMTPAYNPSLNCTGRNGFVGWCESSKLTTLRAAWFDAPDLPAQQKLAREIQLQFLQDVPYIPTGQFLQPTAYRTAVTGMTKGSAVLFFGLRK